MLIQLLLFWIFLSIGSSYSFSSSICLRKSLMSSSHLFLGLPIALLVLYQELRCGFHSAAFLNHLSLGDVAILSANFHFIFCVFCSSIESLHVPSCLKRQLCFFWCIRSNPLLRSQSYLFPFQSLHQMSLHCPHHLQILCPDHRRFLHQCYNFQSCQQFLPDLYA